VAHRSGRGLFSFSFLQSLFLTSKSGPKDRVSKNLPDLIGEWGSRFEMPAFAQIRVAPRCEGKGCIARPAAGRPSKKLIPGRQTAFILSAASLIEGVVDRGVG
jgi:hypothetical protein